MSHLEALRSEAIAKKDQARLAAEKKRVEKIKLKLNSEKQLRTAPSQAALQIKQQNSKLYERSRDELLFAPFPVPSVTALLAELRNSRETVAFLKQVDFKEAAKCYDKKVFEFARQLEIDATQRRIKLMGGI